MANQKARRARPRTLRPVDQVRERREVLNHDQRVSDSLRRLSKRSEQRGITAT